MSAIFVSYLSSNIFLQYLFHLRWVIFWNFTFPILFPPLLTRCEKFEFKISAKISTVNLNYSLWELNPCCCSKPQLSILVLIIIFKQLLFLNNYYFFPFYFYVLFFKLLKISGMSTTLPDTGNWIGPKNLNNLKICLWPKL